MRDEGLYVAGNYPETLKAAYVINASTVFQLIFRVVQSSVQQKTLKKIKVFGSGNWEEVGNQNQTSRDSLNILYRLRLCLVTGMKDQKKYAMAEQFLKI